MSLVINHNLMAMNAARNLGNSYNNLSTSVARLSSGMRINSAADDAAGLAIREMMRTDIRVLNQGVRNANDAISLIQTADGALSVVDEKLTRLKEPAEQAATGTYTWRSGSSWTANIKPWPRKSPESPWPPISTGSNFWTAPSPVRLWAGVPAIR
jgi:flagellin-like hook-associated protein FlgL